MTLQQLDALRDQLKNEMSGSSPNLQKVGQLLTQAKVKKNNPKKKKHYLKFIYLERKVFFLKNCRLL